MASHRSFPLLPKIVDVALLVCLSLGALYASARFGLTPRDPAQGVAVIFAPWTTADRTMMQAVESGGRFVRYGGAPFIAVVVPDDKTYPQRMLAAGAWLIVDPQVLADCASIVSPAARRL